MHKRKGQFSESDLDKRKQSKINCNPVNRDQTRVLGNDATWKHYFADARKAFDEARHKDALILFSRALDFNPKNITLLDCRAATYEKLGDLQAALKDGSTIVALAPMASKGYLRVGKVLSMQNKVKPACAIYERALKKVDPKDTRYYMITKLKDVAERQATVDTYRRRARDFVSVLPYDIICCIFYYLSFERRIQCTAVCKTWRGFTLNWSGMWRHLDFGAKVVSPHTIKQYLSYATEINDSLIPAVWLLRLLKLVNKTLTHLRLDGTSLPYAAISNEVFQLCPNLTHVSFRGFEYMPTDITNRSTTMLNLISLDISPADVTRYPRFEVNDLLRRCQNLQHLQLVCEENDTLHAMQTIPTLCPNLATFRLSPRDLPLMDTFEKEDMGPGLRDFAVPHVYNFADVDGIKMITQHHTTIEALDLRDCYRLSSEFAIVLATKGCPQLRELHLASVSSFSELDLRSIIGACPSLQTVNFYAVFNVTNAILADLSVLTSLKIVDISLCTKVTGAGVRRLVEARKDTLEKLVMNGCTGISADAVHFAAEQLGRHVVECRGGNFKR
ncbi:hypothetical protein DFQ28_004289 [Apophysomyces sp. BC1034]|nr:hypothetical protein DFQ30_011117 [Apophysomyces sp. BC1015]KAG0176398.1 hypothetical protein DFQ29_006184 [Apophysomyces sp. BC1021]KAG0193622.1 hypothetical protein DFQ28_004289 [Apophysomyces sp. BC1034]